MAKAASQELVSTKAEMRHRSAQRSQAALNRLRSSSSPRTTLLFAATLAFTAIALWLGLLAYSIWSEPTIPVYSARIVDLSSVDLSKHGVAAGAVIHWATEPHAGVAVWNAEEETFLVFPLESPPDEDLGETFLYFGPGELPSATNRLMKVFGVGKAFHFRTADSHIDIQMSAHAPLVGSINLDYFGQGWPIDYKGREEFLF